jgi:hypothetical protein
MKDERRKMKDDGNDDDFEYLEHFEYSEYFEDFQYFDC